MKPKPILFSTPMVQAILEGRKKMTRRIVKFPKDYTGGPVYSNGSFGLKYESKVMAPLVTTERLSAKYQPSDILWVRESFIDTYIPDCFPAGSLYYKADNPNVTGLRWKPGIHMPFSAARIFLEVTNVRCERLQDITEEDAKAEGIENLETHKEFTLYKAYHGVALNGGFTNPRIAFENLWEIINGLRSWEANPWVFVYEFKRTEKPVN